MNANTPTVDENILWQRLPSLPDKEGFAGTFAGTVGGAVIVGGGANFPVTRPWDGGEKVWYNSLFFLDNEDGQWRSIDPLPKPVAYGVSISYSGRLICIGGGGKEKNYRDVFALSLSDNRVLRVALPSLPAPRAFMSGALVGDKIYLAGGLEEPQSVEAVQTFWVLDFLNLELGWQELEPWPGPERMLAVAGSDGKSFYLFGGVSLEDEEDKILRRVPLRDAYVYNEVTGWKQLADIPHAVTAAPSPCPVSLAGKLLILGGDDGMETGLKGDAHLGFSRKVLSYSPQSDEWDTTGAELPFSIVTTPAFPWKGGWVITGGEVRPGYRTPEMWRMLPAQE